MKKLLTLLALAAATIVYAGGISGQVADAATGEPIANALVVAKSDNGDAGRAQASERGLYRIEDLDPGNYRVGAMARGYIEARYPGPVPVRGREITEGINFRLRKDRPELGAIAGKVTDRRTGEPVGGAVVVATDGNGRLKVRADGRGNYILKGLKPGNYEVIAVARGYLKEAFPRRVPVTAGNVTKDIDFALAPKPRKGAVMGRVVDARTHEPVAGAVVTARGENGDGPAVTDRRGCYTLKLQPGAYRLVARARGYTPAVFPRPVPVHPGRVTKDIDFPMHPNLAESD
jgi:uncharacterized surface anchored protein